MIKQGAGRAIGLVLQITMGYGARTIIVTPPRMVLRWVINPFDLDNKWIIAS